MVEERPDFTVEIVEPDQAWPVMFRQEQARILAGYPSVVAVEHIGLTAVPDLPAKPTIDVLAVVLDDALQTSIPAFQDFGYLYVPASFSEDPRHSFLHRLQAGKRTHHLHAVAASSPLVPRYLLFRDYLRAHPEEAVRYAAFKTDLANRYSDDRDRYGIAKPPFVDAMMEKAWRWDAARNCE